TNAHVANAGQLVIKAGQVNIPCKVERLDTINDLALCRMDATASVPPLTFAANDPQPGSTVYTISNPKGLDKTITDGLFTGYRELEGRRLVQVSAAISPG